MPKNIESVSKYAMIKISLYAIGVRITCESVDQNKQCL